MDRGKTILFVDNSNIFQGSRHAGWRIDAKKLYERLCEDGPIWQTFFFAAVTHPPRYSQTGFYRMLKEELHFETIILPLGKRTTTCRKCGDNRVVPTEKGVDVALATKLLMLAQSRSFETAIILSGDKDYLETVQAVKSQGLRIEIVSWRASLSQELGHESSANVLFLDDLRSAIELRVAKPPAEEKYFLTQ